MGQASEAQLIMKFEFGGPFEAVKDLTGQFFGEGLGIDFSEGR